MREKININREYKCIGIDISKKKLDVSFLTDDICMEYENSSIGISPFLLKAKSYKPDLVILEGTGGYEALVLTALIKNELPVVRVNPKRIRDFAKALGLIAKTDPIDCRVIAIFGNMVKPAVRSFPSDTVSHLSELVRRRHQLIDIKKMETTRRGTSSNEIKAHIQSHLDWLKTEIKQLDLNIQKELNDCPVFKEKVGILRSAKGIGPVLTAVLLTRLPELGSLNKQQVSALVGVAPFNRDSGQKKGTRSIFGGRKDVRSALYMGTLVACRYNPTIKKFYQRLKEQGKVEKVAITACMRKLLVILNTMLKNGTPWEEKTA